MSLTATSSELRPAALMKFGEVQAELRAYRPLTAAQVRTDPEFLRRQAELWRRLDQLASSWRRRTGGW